MEMRLVGSISSGASWRLEVDVAVADSQTAIEALDDELHRYQRPYSGCRSAARRVGDEDSAQAQSHAAARAQGADGVATVDASGDTGGAETACGERKAVSQGPGCLNEI